MKRSRHSKKLHRHLGAALALAASVFLIFAGLFTLWVATLEIPDISSFTTRKISESTKIYDRTGTILLFDTGVNTKRSVVALEDISPNIISAAIAIEDSNFYNNSGIEPTSIIRAVLADVISGGYEQGASTITQQVVKNSLLTQDKTIARKIKELVLAIKLSRVVSKDIILQTYITK